jgi:hypothetical protein
MAANLEARAATLPQHDCKLLNMSTVKPEPIKWLWPGKIPAGMYSLLAGQPGVGKTTISYSIAAIVTTGGKWPLSEHRATPGRVIILTAEDDPKYTLAPRLIAAGADLSKVEVIQSVTRARDDNLIDTPLLLTEDMHQLDGVFRQYPDTALLIIDPLSAYLGVKDAHRDADVRQALGPLTDLAAQHSVAILGITHLSKAANSSAMARFMGSTGIIAAARAAFLATRHEEQLLFLPVKSNVAPIEDGGLVYRVAGKSLPDGIETSCIEWIAQTDVEADDALRQQQERGTAPKLAEAIDFLQDQLQHGSKRQQEIEAEAKCSGIAWATVRRAKTELDIQSYKDRFSGGWCWCSREQLAARESTA